jgi:hypothetical protein
VSSAFDVGRIAVVLSLLAAACIAPSTPCAEDPRAVPTFESIGLYWSPGGSEGVSESATVRYRSLGSSTWTTGHPLWFDARISPSPPFTSSGEYRGSIALVDPGTTYEIELTAEGGARAVLAATTWSEEFPIGETVTLPESSSDTLVIRQSGTPEGYVLYTAEPGQTATIDVANAREHNIVVEASYVIIRGLVLKGARTHGIKVSSTGSCTNIVIEDNDISGWGRVDEVGFGVGFDAAIRAENPLVERLIIQRNRIHHPRADANSWCEKRDGRADPACKTHPEGPHGIRLTDTGGNHVIRFNTLESDDAHYFADGIGGGTFSYAGFPGPDSDVYGNFIERCWDNPIESEGGNANARIWANYIDRSYSPIAITPLSVGPIYIWRNVVDRSRKGPPEITGDTDSDPRGRFLKGGSGNEWGGGRVYVYHNTIVQRSPAAGSSHTLGVRTGITTKASGGKAYGIVSRNNILHVISSRDRSVADDSLGCGVRRNDFDFDLYNGKINSPLPQEANGIELTPVYAADNNPLEFFLDPASPGHDSGVVLPGFNNGSIGDGPEIGAFETGAPPLEFGTGAYRGGSP